jgi:phosphinothricin acetyltransferase
MATVTIRPAAAADLPAINDLYNHYVRETAVTFDVTEYTVEERRPWFERFGERGRHRLLVAEDGGRVLGYAGTLPFRPKAAYETSVETTIYLWPDAHGRGLGARLYQRLFADLAGEDVHRAYAGVTLPNPASIALHERFGFRPVGLYREVGRKFERYWDVQWLEKELG